MIRLINLIMLLLIVNTLFAINEVKVTAAALRDSPKGKLIMRLPLGTKIEILNKNENWCEVKVQQTTITGYMHRVVIGSSPLVMEERHKHAIKQLTFLDTGFQSEALFKEDFQQEGRYAYNHLDTVFRRANEALEAFIYFRENRVLPNHLFNLLECIFVRKFRCKNITSDTSIRKMYQNTPVEVFKAGKIFDLPPKLYLNPKSIEINSVHNYSMPKVSTTQIKAENIRNIFFMQLDNEDDFASQICRFDVIMPQLLKIGYPKENPFTLSVENKKFVYSSDKPIHYLVIPKNGGKAKSASGILKYTISALDHKIVIDGLKAKKGDWLIFIPSGSKLKELFNNISIIYNGKAELICDNCHLDDSTWVQFDIDSDGKIDFIYSRESWDIEKYDDVIYYVSDNKWVGDLLYRSYVIF